VPVSQPEPLAGSDQANGGQHHDAPRRGPTPLRVTALAAAILVAAGILLLLNLSAYFGNRYQVPVGNDAPEYLARARIVAAGGLDALPDAFPPPLTANPDRPAYPVIANLLESAAGIRPERLAFVLSAVASVAIGLAAAAFALAALAEPTWSAPVYALLVGASTSTVLTAIGHIDNLMADALLLAGAGAVVLAADGRPAIAAGILLFGATAIVHWNFVALFGAVLVAFAIAVIPSSLRALRGGSRPIDTPVARVGAVLIGSAALGAGAFAFIPGTPRVTELSASQISSAYARTSSKFRLDLLGPLALVGAAGLAFLHRTRRRVFGLLLLLAWAAVGIGAIVLYAFGVSLPAHRLLPFAYGIPILAAVGLVSVARLAGERLRRVGVVVGVGVLAIGLAGSALVAYRILSERTPFLSETALLETAGAAEYASRYAGDRPVILVVNRPNDGGATLYGVAPAYRWTAAWLPMADRSRLYVYLGSVPNLLAGHPTVRDDALYDDVSTTLWDSVEPVAKAGPVIIVMKSFSSQFGSYVEHHPESRIAPRLIQVDGPPPPGGTLPPVRLPGRPSDGTLFVLAVATLLFLAVAGSGWSASLLPTGWIERALCAPTFGIAALALGGYLADRLGARLTGGSGVAIVIAVAVVGWLPIALRGVVRSRRAGRGDRPAMAGDEHPAVEAPDPTRT